MDYILQIHNKTGNLTIIGQMRTNGIHVLPLNDYFAIVPLTHCFEQHLIFDMLNKRTKIDCVIQHVNDQTIQIVICG